MTDLSVVRLDRTDGDAAARASETARPDALIRDEYASLLTASSLTASAGSACAQMASGDDEWLSDDDARQLHPRLEGETR